MDNQRKDYSDPERPHKGTASNNNRSITCLAMTWKILTVQIREEIYYLRKSCGQFPEESKRFRREPEEQEVYYTLINTLRTTKWHGKKLAMADDMALQSWIIDCLKMYKISHKVIKFIENTLKNWRVKLTVGEKILAEVKIQRGIFKGNALSLFLFIIAIMPLNHMFRKCTGGYKLYKWQK